MVQEDVDLPAFLRADGLRAALRVTFGALLLRAVVRLLDFQVRLVVDLRVADLRVGDLRVDDLRVALRAVDLRDD